MIHCKKNYQLYKDATCHSLWPSDFTDVTVLYSLFFLALRYCFSLYTFILLWLPLWLLKFFAKFFFMVVLFQGHLSPLTAAFSGCSFGLFCPVLLGGGFLALHRAPISSDRFFIRHSLRPSSTQLLLCNHSGFCSH